MLHGDVNARVDNDHNSRALCLGQHGVWKIKKWMMISGAMHIPQSVHHKLLQDETIARGVCAGNLDASMTPCAVALYQQDDYFIVSQLICLGNLLRTLNNTLRILVYSIRNPLKKMYRLSNCYAKKHILATSMSLVLLQNVVHKYFTTSYISE